MNVNTTASQDGPRILGWHGRLPHRSWLLKSTWAKPEEQDDVRRRQEPIDWYPADTGMGAAILLGDRQKTLHRGPLILARMIARTHLQRLESAAWAAPVSPAEAENEK